jgi:NADH dehydrogenase
VQYLAPSALAEACARRGVRLVHVSALGLRAEARSYFLRSKHFAERKIAASGADYSIVRPALLDGDGGYGARWLRRVAGWAVHPYPADAKGLLAPLDVRDLGEALAVLCECRGERWREVELGGGARRTLAEHLDALRDAPGRLALRLPIPALLARIASHLCDLLHVTPFSYGYLELLRRDNAPRVNALPALLGRAPRPVGAAYAAARTAYAFAATPTGHETPVPPSPQ